MINSIIDVYHLNTIDFRRMVEGGVVAVIHKGTHGTKFKDPKYHDRREQAMAAGLLWGSYHFSTNEDVRDQAENFLAHVRPTDSDFVAIDWEPIDGPDMTIEQARDFARILKNELGRWPCLYGGHILRESIGSERDEVLANCPLWYARYAKSPIGIPAQTWQRCTLWQYTDGADGPEPRETDGVSGADRNIFFGTVEELRESWPFTKRPKNAKLGQAYSTLLADR